MDAGQLERMLAEVGRVAQSKMASPPAQDVMRVRTALPHTLAYMHMHTRAREHARTHKISQRNTRTHAQRRLERGRSFDVRQWGRL